MRNDLDDARDRLMVDATLRVVSRVDPAAYRRIQAMRACRYAPEVCDPGATSCTGGEAGPDCVFAEHPADLGVPECAEHLFHEALHRDPSTGRLLRHPFGDGEPDERQRAQDEIYQRARRLRVRVETFLRTGR